MERVYIAPVKFHPDDSVAETGTSKRSFCTECSAMLWNYHDEWPQVRLPHLVCRLACLLVYLSSPAGRGETGNGRAITAHNRWLAPKLLLYPEAKLI